VRDSRVAGLDLELKGHPVEWLEMAGSVSLQEARYRGGGSLPNSPDRMAQLRAAVPLWGDRFSLAMAARYLSARLTTDGTEVAGPVLADLTLNANRLHPQLDLQFGVRNLTDRRYHDPLSAEHATPALRRAGRTAFVRLDWRPGE
jgi:outer membrane receptor protein involved in Fe transport